MHLRQRRRCRLFLYITLHIHRLHKVRKCDFCGTPRTSLEFLNHHISLKHSATADNEDEGAPEEITFESLNPDFNGMFTIFLVTNVQYSILRQEFRKYGGSNIEICSGRHEGSFLISFRKPEDLWSALSAHKGGELGMRNLKLVFKDDTDCEERKPEDDHEEGDDEFEDDTEEEYD